LESKRNITGYPGTVMRRTALVLLLALRAFAADPLVFIQASDPQFGMFAEDRNFRQETANWEFVVANANRLHPAFLVVTGDLTNKTGDADQIAEYKRINLKLDPAIHLYSVPGNHDVANDPAPATLAAYRKTYGPDYYSFREANLYGIVLNSSLFKAPALVGEEAAKQEEWLERELVKAKESGAVTVVFQHIPFFLEKAGEPDQYFNIPITARRRILALLQRYGVHYVFAGHYHRNSFGREGDLEMVTTGPAGMPIGPDPSGFRLAALKGTRIEHTWYGLGNIPNLFPIPPAPPKP
jgi:3',5'-cyclic AMP phosphodiesterase CpdA